ncbi:hypothetical protein AK812_SmicGene28938 [Symbiodinium microadriaticum]|uniref:Uncharacterized protein n=1 Tax=Symbiodinium microadriaticum TaxID=2951 RepID=A0A1Q9D338_SYMMI|nr:hypothetical protein AK812_SmicGene28938 [Symbiodinium microadriaticum]
MGWYTGQQQIGDEAQSSSTPLQLLNKKVLLFYQGYGMSEPRLIRLTIPEDWSGVDSCLSFLERTLEEDEWWAQISDQVFACFRTLHAQLKQEPEFAEVSLKKVQTALQQLRATPAAGVREAGPGENLWTAAGDGDIARVEDR